MFQSKTLPEFWDWYNDLPEDIQRRADKQFSLFAANPKHPSIQLKPAGEFWSARVTDAYRALDIREENVFTWCWIGPHDEYLRLLKQQSRRMQPPPDHVVPLRRSNSIAAALRNALKSCRAVCQIRFSSTPSYSCL
jgi:hypothetical protein